MPEMIIPPNTLAEWMRWMEVRLSKEERRLEFTPDDDVGGTLAVPVEYSWSAEGTVGVEVGQHRLYNDTGSDRFMEKVRAGVGTAPVGDDMIVTVNQNGTTIFATGVTVPDGTHTGSGVPDLTQFWLAGNYLTVDILQVGSSTPGSDLTVTVVTT